MMPLPIEADCLLDCAGIRHGFFTREGGVSAGLYESLNCGLGSRDEAAAVLENRARVARHLGAASHEVVTLYQVHTAIALVVDTLVPRDSLPKADAIVTKTPGLAIGALAADCAPVLLADPEARVIGAAHAGWRGAVAGVVEAAITTMISVGAARHRIVAAVGPCINQADYEVGPEFETELLGLDPANARYFKGCVGARPHFDLPGYVAGRLAAAHIGTVEISAPCTYANESKFFSYRRSQHRSEADYGRQISAILLT